jgi:adenosine deaminase
MPRRLLPPREAAVAAVRQCRRPHELRLLLRAMPKGADLHNHMGGSVYAEDFMRWAGEKACASMLPRWPSPRPARRVSP